MVPLTFESVAKYEVARRTDIEVREDWRTVGGWYTASRSGDLLPLSDDEIRDLASVIVGEIVERGIGTFFPESMHPLDRGLLLDVLRDLYEDHLQVPTLMAEKIFSGASLLVTQNAVDGNHVYWLHDVENVYGIIRLKSREAMNAERLIETEPRHRITEKERDELFSGITDLYAYEFDMPVRFTPFSDREKRFIRAVADASSNQARTSLSENKIVPLRVFYSQKSRGAHVGSERQTPAGFLQMFNLGQYPIHSRALRDGIDVQLHRSGNDVILYTDTMDDISARLPSLISAAKTLSDSPFVVTGSLEMWGESSIIPSDVSREQLLGNGRIEESQFVLRAHDCVFLSDDIHQMPFDSRVGALESMHFDSFGESIPDLRFRITRTEHTISRTPEELKKHFQSLRAEPASEGIYSVPHGATYMLDARTGEAVRFRNTGVLDLIVIERLDRGPGRYVYSLGLGIEPEFVTRRRDRHTIGDKQYLNVGTSAETDVEAAIGDVVSAEFDRLSLHYRSAKSNPVTAATYSVSTRGLRVLRASSMVDGMRRALQLAADSTVLSIIQYTPGGVSARTHGTMSDVGALSKV